MRSLTRLCLCMAVMYWPVTAIGDVPVTPWGKPDLSGVWTTATLTPLETPAELLSKASLSADERAAMETAAEAAWEERDGKPPPGSVGGYNREWLDPGMKALTDGRKSLIIDPPDGRIPWRQAAKQASGLAIVRFQSPTDGYQAEKTARNLPRHG